MTNRVIRNTVCSICKTKKNAVAGLIGHQKRNCHSGRQIVYELQNKYPEMKQRMIEIKEKDPLKHKMVQAAAVTSLPRTRTPAQREQPKQFMIELTRG